MYSTQKESSLPEEDRDEHPGSLRIIHNPAQVNPPPDEMNNENYTKHISDWNTAADEYDEAELENPDMLNGQNFVLSPQPFYQWVPNLPVYMSYVPPQVHAYVPPERYQQPMYPGPVPVSPENPNCNSNNISKNTKEFSPAPNVKQSNSMAYRHPENLEMANYQIPPTYVPPTHYYYSPQNYPLPHMSQQSNISKVNRPPKNVKQNNGTAYRNPSNRTMANYQTQPTYFPPQHYCFYPENSQMYLPHYPFNPINPMNSRPYSTLYQPYLQPCSPKYRSKSASQVPQKSLSVKSCKPNVKPSSPEHNVSEKNNNKTPVKLEILPVLEDKELEHVKKMKDLKINSEKPNDEKIINVKEGPIVVETVIPNKSIKKVKEHISTKPKKKKKNKPVTNGPININQENQKHKKKKDESIVIEAKKETSILKKSQISISSSKPEVQETEPVKPVAKTWAGLFSGCSTKSNDKVLMLHDSTATNTIAESIAGPLKSVPDNSSNSSVIETNNNKKQTLQAKHSPSSNNSGVDDNTLQLQRLGEFLSNYNLDHKTVHLQPRGLINRNTFCYINATLQALLACPLFFNLIKSVQFKLKNRDPQGTQKSQIPILESMVQFISEFQYLSNENGKTTPQQDQVMSVATQETPDFGPAFEPSYVYKMLSFEEGCQEDAEEFMSYLLNDIDEEMIKLIKMSKSNISNSEIPVEDDAINNKEWTKVNGKHNMVTRQTEVEKTPLSEIFRGQLRTCTVKSYENEPTENIEPFFTLKLDIEEAKSVREALDMLITKNKLEGLTCPKTNSKLDAYQQVTIDQLPYVLLLHLKCFEYKEQKLTKIMKNVEFSVNLEIKSKLLSTNSKDNMKKTRHYKLIAVVYHNGKEATEGHYFTDVFYESLGRWLRFDDANVCFVTDEEVCQQKSPCMPYLLFYRRKDTIDHTIDNKSQ